MLPFTEKIDKAYLVRNFLVYLNVEIPAIFSWSTVKTRECLLRFSALRIVTAITLVLPDLSDETEEINTLPPPPTFSEKL